MIFEINIPDEVYSKYGSQQAIYQRLMDTADLDSGTNWALLFTDQQLADYVFP